MIVLSEVWSSSHACCDFSESRSAWRRARSFSIAMTSPRFCGPGQQRLDLADAALGGADPGVVVDHLGGHVLGLAAALLDLAERCRTRPSRRRSGRTGPAGSSCCRRAGPCSSLVLCSSATEPPHELDEADDLGAGARHVLGVQGDLPVEMTARVIGVAVDCLAGHAAVGRLRAFAPLSRRSRARPRRRRRSPPTSCRRSRRSRLRPAAGAASTAATTTEDNHEGDGHQGPLLRHGAETPPTPDRFPSVAVPRCRRAPTAAADPSSPWSAAGVAGLAAAHRIRAGRCPDVDVIVLEASPRVGGSLRTAEVGGVVTDVGAEAMLNRRPEARRPGPRGRTGRRPGPPGDDLGLAVDPRPAGAAAAHADGGPARPAGAGRRALARTAWPAPRWTACCPRPRSGDRDVSVGDLVEERLGKEVVDRLVEPMLGGVYAGHARELSARAAVPQLVALLDRDRSLTRGRGGRHATADPTARPGLRGHRRGGGPAARGAGPRVRRHRPHRRDGPRPRTPARRRLEPGRRPDPRPGGGPGDAVVLATPARPTARLLERRGADGGARLWRASSTRRWPSSRSPSRRAAFPEVAGLGLPGAAGRRPRGQGVDVLVREVGLGPRGGRQRDRPVLLLRCSIGRHREEQTLQVTDEELVDLALRDLADAIGLSVRPVDVARAALGRRAAAVRRRPPRPGRRGPSRAGRLPGLAVCGAAYDGVGIPACIASAHLAAAKVVADLATMGP